MSRLTTILLGALAVGAIIFLAIYEPLTRSTRENKAAVREGLVMRLDPAKVNIIRISAGDKDLEVRRRGNGWQLGTKSKDRADTALIEKILTTASTLRFFDRIEARELTNDNLSDFGLRKPKRKIEFEGREKTTLYLGKDAASEDRLYVRLGDSNDVYLVSDEILREAFREAADFRDRRLTDLTPDQVDRLVIRREGGEIELVHEATGWQITKPLHAKADPRKVQEYLNRLLALRITDFVAEDTGDLSIYGLTEGKDEITFFAEGNERHQTLRLGADKEGQFFGQFTARDSVYRVPAETRELLKVEPADLRDRHLITLNPDIVDMIRIRTPQQEFAIRRGAAGWELKQGDSTRPASEAAVLALWDALSTDEASSYTPVAGVNLADLGLDPPQFTVELLSVLSENTPETRAGEQLITSIAFGQSKEGESYVRLDDSPEAAVVPADLADRVALDPALWVAPR